jgi:hypothetical protein
MGHAASSRTFRSVTAVRAEAGKPTGIVALGGRAGEHDGAQLPVGRQMCSGTRRRPRSPAGFGCRQALDGTTIQLIPKARRDWRARSPPDPAVSWALARRHELDRLDGGLQRSLASPLALSEPGDVSSLGGQPQPVERLSVHPKLWQASDPVISPWAQARRITQPTWRRSSASRSSGWVRNDSAATAAARSWRAPCARGARVSLPWPCP